MEQHVGINMDGDHVSELVNLDVEYSPKRPPNFEFRNYMCLPIEDLSKTTGKKKKCNFSGWYQFVRGEFIGRVS